MVRVQITVNMFKTLMVFNMLPTIGVVNFYWVSAFHIFSSHEPIIVPFNFTVGLEPRYDWS